MSRACVPAKTTKRAQTGVGPLRLGEAFGAFARGLPGGCGAAPGQPSQHHWLTHIIHITTAAYEARFRPPYGFHSVMVRAGGKVRNKLEPEAGDAFSVEIVKGKLFCAPCVRRIELNKGQAIRYYTLPMHPDARRSGGLAILPI